MTAGHAGDFAKQVAHRREQLGLSWAGGSSEAVIRIETIDVSGRNIRQRD